MKTKQIVKLTLTSGFRHVRLFVNPWKQKKRRAMAIIRGRHERYCRFWSSHFAAENQQSENEVAQNFPLRKLAIFWQHSPPTTVTLRPLNNRLTNQQIDSLLENHRCFTAFPIQCSDSALFPDRLTNQRFGYSTRLGSKMQACLTGRLINDQRRS